MPDQKLGRVDVASYPGLLTAVFVACSTSAGEGLVKLVMCSDLDVGCTHGGVALPSVQLLGGFLKPRNVTKTA